MSTRTTMSARRLGATTILVALAGCSGELVADVPETLSSTADELRVCASGTTLKGIDVSYYQGSVDWAKVQASGRRFAFARVSDGLSRPDTKFASNWPKMKAAGLVRGTYQFFRPQRDPTAQAQVVIDRLAAAGGLKPGDLPPVLDLETSDGVASSTVVARATTWLQVIERAYGVRPIVYTSAAMSSVIGSRFSAYPLWVANYGVSCPRMPSGWSTWKLWQSSQSGSVSGVSGAVDLDVFNGGTTTLGRLTLPGTPLAEVGPTLDSPDETTDATPEDGSQGATMGHPTPDVD